ncbi:MAG TPA: iron-containing alcohol dehydrogenase [Vicinamibacterales bacterium]|nr:iron-containing alcohol dehydrogenase [Vicinamibacterales bacterium]
MTPDPISTGFSGEFNLPRLERVISGAGTIARVGAELDRLGATRVVIVTGRTLGASPLLESVRRSIGDRSVFVFTGARQHVPSSTVSDLVCVIEQQKADAVISFGGGSPIDTVKAAAYEMADGPPHLAIPTTLSAGEFTSVAGITDEQTRIKRPVHHARIAPRIVVVDPLMTFETPDWLWVSTAMRSLDHAVEASYSTRHHVIGEAMASRGLTLLRHHLPRSIQGSRDDQVEHRLRCQLAAWCAVFGMTNAGFGLSHALGHQIGPRWNVPHGITSCITLPHAMRFMAERVPERFAPITLGLGLPLYSDAVRSSAFACVDRVEAFLSQFEVPRRLRDVGVPRDEIDDIAGVVRDAMEEAAAVMQPISRAEIAAVLAAAY